MADTPIPKQQGLSNEDLAKMKPIEQEYKWDNPAQFPNERQIYVIDKIGVKNQQNNFKNLLKRNLVFYDKAKSVADSKDEYALDTCLREFSNNMADFIVSLIHAQLVRIVAPLTTMDTITSGILTSADKNFTFVGAGSGVGTETADTLETSGSNIDIS